MKISYAKIQDRRFSIALSKLATHGGFTNYKEVANIKTFLKQFEKVSKVAQGEWIQLLKQYSVLDAKGEFVPRTTFNAETGQTTTQPGSFTVTPGKEEEFEMKAADFNAKTVDVWVDPVHFETVKGCGLSPSDLIQLEDLIIEPAAEEAAPVAAAQ